MIPIGKDENRINWEAIHAEYIGSDISQRKLAEKYHIKEGVLLRKANRENWAKHRENARNKAVMKAEQKTAEALSDNATIAARIKAKLLRKLEKELDSLPDSIGTETRQSMIERDKGKTKEATKVFKLRDLAAAYRDLTADMVSTETAGSDLMRDFVEASRRRLGNG